MQLAQEKRANKKPWSVTIGRRKRVVHSHTKHILSTAHNILLLWRTVLWTGSTVFLRV